MHQQGMVNVDEEAESILPTLVMEPSEVHGLQDAHLGHEVNKELRPTENNK